MSSILLTNTACSIEGQSNLSFSVPYFNNIVLYHGDTINLGKTLYYGDEMTLSTWAKFNLPIGGNPVVPLYNLIPGYRYVLTLSDNTFRVYNSSGYIVLTRTNITSIADMGITFNVYSSHQFEIRLGAFANSYFFIPVYYNGDAWSADVQNPFDVGLDNIYIPDRVRPYLPSDVDNPYLLLYNIMSCDDVLFIRKLLLNVAAHKDILDGFITQQIGKNGSFSKLAYNNQFYKGLYDRIEGTIDDWEVEGDIQTYSFDLALLLRGLYPALMPVERGGETNNNRPLYEPWLITKLSDAKFSDYSDYFYTTDDFDSYVVDAAADLSPNWSY